MKLKVLADDMYRIVAVMNSDDCPAEEFLAHGEKATEAMRLGLMEMLKQVAMRGLHDVPAAWLHEADKEKAVHEFIKGRLRLFFFKGHGRDIAVCTSGTIKSGRKADRQAVTKADGLRKSYINAFKNQSLEVVEDEAE